ncbi:MAG: hypothetical protein WCG04_07445, partial [Alphaproteobacteria bacterium]
MSTLEQNTQINLILDALHHDPFAFLGFHQEKSEKSDVKTYRLKCFVPYATRIDVQTAQGWETLKEICDQGFFEWQGKAALNIPCKIRIHQHDKISETYDTYSFGPMIT